MWYRVTKITIKEYQVGGGICIAGAFTGLCAAGYIVGTIIGLAVAALLTALTIAIYIFAGVTVLLGIVKAYTTIRDKPHFDSLRRDLQWNYSAEQHRIRPRSTITVVSSRLNEVGNGNTQRSTELPRQ